VSFCYHFASVVRPSTITKKYSPLKPLGHLRPNFGGMVHGWSPSKIVSGSPNLQPTWSLLLRIKKGDEILKFFISETTGTIGTKLCLDSHWITPFQNSVRQSRHPTIMATVAKNRKGGWHFNFFLLKLLGQLDSSFATKILWWSPFKILSGSPVLRPRWTLLLNINDSCTLSRMQGFACLLKSYKTNMFRLFQWNTVCRRI